ncbi:winged helix-turn-helix domain-containing protein [Shewanella mesophila]|uniref:nSTAND1 domain-containing NTPase n=1 Tax=Shewanella mesophila TaxID=2864208 RepID=UPI001C65760C|nr:winged helix-turn-helix domain-containing protein [Shewanella mesophila]QYJ87617.1 winged helix-turn-helix domain-containing protein [Shewanella mesophila]
MDENRYFFGDWQVVPSANTLRSGSVVKQLEPKAMDVLQLLCRHHGEVLSSDDIVAQCWPTAEVGDNPLHKIINQLRRALGDSATQPTYIETIRKRGYRTLAEVSFPVGSEEAAKEQGWQGDSPYPGLKAFGPEHAGVFFGRSQQIATLLERIGQQIQFGRGFCLVLGPSGSGKSSLVSAGVMPNLMSEHGYNGLNVKSFASLDLADVSSQHLLIDLASVMLDWEINDVPVFDGWSAEQLAHLLQTEPKSAIAHCNNVLRTHVDHLSQLALFIDRLEVLLSSPLFSDAERHQFVDLIEQLASSGSVLVISACRNDFYPLLVEYPSLMAGKSRGAHFDLAPPTRQELLQMIRLPAIAANLTWEFDQISAMPLDELICSDAAGNPDTLPMLQFMLQALYLQRSEDNQLSASVYRQLGGIEGAIGKQAEETITCLTAQQQASLPSVLSLLVTLKEDENSITSRSARWSQLNSQDERQLVQAMVDSRLFVSHLQNDNPCFSIAHEALLRRWPRVTEWIEAHHDSLSVKSRLFHLSQRWLSENKQSAYLLAAGKPLNEAEQLCDNPFFTLDKPELAFIAASRRRTQVRRWTGRATVALLCLLTFISILMSVKSHDAEQQAQQKRLAAENLLGFMVGDFADKLRGIGRMDLLDGISNKALEYFSDFSVDDDEKHLSFDARFQHGQTLEAMGEVAYSRNKVDEARSALLAAQNKMAPLLNLQPNHLDLLKALGANAFWLGQLHYDNSDWRATQPWFEQYLNYSQRMYRVAPDNVDAMMELSYAHNSLGSVYMKRKDFSRATAAFEQSLQLKLQALTLEPDNSQRIADVANARSWLASAILSTGEIDRALDIHQQIQSEFELLQFKKQPYLLDRVTSSYYISSKLLFYKGNIVNAYEKASKGLETIDEALVVDPDNQVWKSIRYYSLFQLLELSDQYFDSDNAFNIERLAVLLTADEQLTRSAKNREVWAAFQYAAARHLFNVGKHEQSQRYIEPAIASYQALTKEFSQNSSYTLRLAESQLLQAQLLQKKLSQKTPVNPTQHSAEITALCAKAHSLLSPIVLQDKDPRYGIPLAKALDCLGELDNSSELVQHLSSAGVGSITF